MGLYSAVVFPLVIGVMAAVLLSGVVTLVWIRAHVALKWAVTALYIATALQFFMVVGLLFAGLDVPLVTTVGYVLVSVIMLPLLGISRLGEPEAAALDPDPNRPILQPDQLARVDAIAALVVGGAILVVAWRIEIILTAAA